MINVLKRNLEKERQIIDEMKKIQKQLKLSDDRERRFYEKSLNSLKQQMLILNKSVPLLLAKISPVKKLSEGSLQKEHVSVRPPTPSKEEGFASVGTSKTDFIGIDKEDKERFESELGIYSTSLKKLKKLEKKEEKKPSQIVSISNRLFFKISESLAPNFPGLKEDLRRANSRFTISIYLSIALFISLLIFIGSLILWGVLVGLGVLGILHIWIPFFLTLICIAGFYIYPASEKNSFRKKILYELPFATIHMAAIAGSNLEPTRIFKIIAMSSEYPAIGIEMKKIVNLVEIYGYDLVNSLKNAARTTPNNKLAELFSGLATNIVSGGDLKNYLEKKAENFLTDYKLERKRYTSLAETFMDVYISIMIAAPLIFVVMLIIMNVTGLSIGLPFEVLMFLIVGGVVLLNIIFLLILNIKQPKV